ncbi:MAG: hypothetical protein II826_09015 [Prevotella sp.]|nr:hypothetical protein [Prevotella sp.]
MKKLFTLCAAVLLCVAAGAQVDETFQFVDADGNVVPDGSVITVNTLNEDGQMSIPLSVRNVSGAKAAASLYETIDQLPGGTWQTCAFGNCMTLEASGYSPKSVVDADYDAYIQTEWIPETGQYATWEAKLQIHVFNVMSVSRFGQTVDTPGTTVTGYGPTVTVRFEYADPSTPALPRLWWGYTTQDEEMSTVGVAAAETYDCAAFYSGSQGIPAGKTIHAVRFALYSSNVKDVKVWIAQTRPTKVDADALVVVNVDKPVAGINEVALPAPYEIGPRGVYVGYSFTITKANTTDDKYPVAVAGEDLQNALWLRTSSTVSTWSDLYGQGFGRLYMQLLLEGEYPANAVSIASANLGECITSIGGEAKLTVPVINEGSEDVTSIEYRVSNGERNMLTFDRPLAFGSTRSVTISLRGDTKASAQPLTFSISSVNGKANQHKASSASFVLTTTLRVVDKCVAVEQYTGTTCGWCPRGHVGMKKMHDEFGDRFAGIAVHRYATSSSADAMYISTYNHVSFDGAPSCRINRGEVIDPYYGSGNDILDDMRAELAIPAKVDVSVTGQWNDDSTKVVATAILESLVPKSNYKIEYVLVADSLSGTTKAWSQTNYYAQYTRSQVEDDLAIFASGGIYGKSSIPGFIFNDVALAVGKSTQTKAPGVLEVGVPTENTYTLSMPTGTVLKKAIHKDKVTVMALVIDATTNLITNVAKFRMPGYKAAVKGDVNVDGTVDVADISTILSVMASSESYTKEADVNDDGAVDVSDISSVLTIMAGE